MDQSRTSTIFKRARLGALLCFVAGTTGCSTGTGGLASLNPFSKSVPEATEVITDPAETKAPNPLANLAQGTRAQASSMGMAVKGAYGKTKDGIVGLFNSDKATSSVDAETGEQIPENDPLRLDNKPSSVQPEILVANGQLWEASGNLDRAKENYSKAIENDPNNGAALASLARLNYRQQRYAEAVPFFERAITASPKEAALYNDLGLTYSKSGRHDEAAKMIEKAVELAPGTSRYANNMATVQLESVNTAAALETLKKHNSAAVAHYNMAYLHYSNNETDKALQQLSQVLAAGETSQGDPSSQAAVQKARELTQQLTGKASAIAQAVPSAVENAKETSQALGTLANGIGNVVSQVTGTGDAYRVQLSDGQAGVVPQSATPIAAGPMPTAIPSTATPGNGTAAPANLPVAIPSTASTNAVIPDSAKTAAPIPGSLVPGSFALPPEFATPPAVAEQPQAGSLKR